MGLSKICSNIADFQAYEGSIEPPVFQLDSYSNILSVGCIFV